MINGILIVNKPINYTSRDIVNIVSKKLKTKKIGHTGTLDPIATGVLVLTIGPATKISELLMSEKKEYIAETKLGIETDTLDITGNIVKKLDFNINKEEIDKVLKSFVGSYNQEVPLYSAVKINGKKLYEYARNNEKIELPKRNVTIYNIELLEVNDTGFKFKCLVSKGTYIRSLIKDICLKLNTIGVMQNLIRTKQGNFNIEDSYTIEDISNSKYKIIALEEIFKDIYTINVDDELRFKVKNGQIVDNIYNKDLVVFKDKSIIAIYKNENNKLKPYKMFL